MERRGTSLSVGEIAAAKKASLRFARIIIIYEKNL
jgi:hypothetical protein